MLQKGTEVHDHFFIHELCYFVEHCKEKKKTHTNKQEIPFNKVVHLYSIFAF